MTDQPETVLRTKEIDDFNSVFRPKVLNVLLSCKGVENMSIKELNDLTDRIENCAWNSLRGIKR